MEIFFDNGGSQAGEPIPVTNTAPSAANTNQGPSGQYLLISPNNFSIKAFEFYSGPIASGGTGGYESDDESPMQSAIEESLRANASAEKPTGDTSKKPAAPPSRFGTIGGLQHEEEDSDEEGC